VLKILVALFLSLLCLLLIKSILFFLNNSKHNLKNPINIDFLIFISISSVFLFYLMPSLLRMFSGWKYERFAQISIYEIVTVYFIEFIYYVIWLFFIYYILSRKIIFHRTKILNVFKSFLNDGRTYYNNSISENNNYEKLFILIVIIYGFIAYSQSIFDFNFIFSFDWLFLPLVMRASPIFGLLVICFGYHYFNRCTYCWILLMTAVIYTITISRGSHGEIFAPFLYIIFAVIFIKKNKIMIVVSIFALFFLLIFYSEMHEMRAYFTAKDEVTIGEKFEFFSEIADERSESSLLDDVERRFGENSRVSVGYLRMVDRDFFAGMRPIINSLYSVFPRILYPDKPFSGSVDGTKYSSGMYLIHQEIYNRGWNMSGFFPGLHAYWEGGFIGVVLAAFFSGLFVGMMILFLDNFSCLGLFILIPIFDVWWQMPNIWASEVILRFITYVCPVLLLWFSVKFFFKLTEKTFPLLNLFIYRLVF
jgi:hypothetical protein